jgi:type IV pilus assembly protein PilN
VPVHLLNELVKQTPEGIYFKTIKQDGQSLTVAGIAQTQERISELLRNTAYSSEWLVRPELVESKSTTAQGANREQRQLFEFSMRLNVKRPQDAASAPAAAASIPAAVAKKV